MAERIGLTGPLESSAPPPPSGNAFYRALGEAEAEVTLAAWDAPRSATALGWFEDYLLATGHLPFVPASGASSLSGAIYNRETLDRFGVFIRKSQPKGRTKSGQVSADAISGYQSAIYQLRCREAGYDIAPPVANLRAKGHLHKIWLKEDGPKGDRAVGRGFRAFHFERLAARLPVTCAVEIVERSAGLTAHNLFG